MSKWTKCTDKLPKIEGNYSVGNPEYESGQCYFAEGEWLPHNLNPYNIGTITHWMPLPKKPTI